MVWGLRRRCRARYSAKKAWTWGAITWLDMACSSRLGIGFEAVGGGAQELRHRREGFDHRAGHLRLFEVDSAARAPAPLRPKSPQTLSAASDRKSARLPSSRPAG